MLKDGMREIESASDFDQVLTTFLDWRQRYDEGVATGKIKPIKAEVTEAA